MDNPAAPALDPWKLIEELDADNKRLAVALNQAIRVAGLHVNESRPKRVRLGIRARTTRDTDGRQVTDYAPATRRNSPRSWAGRANCQGLLDN